MNFVPVTHADLTEVEAFLQARSEYVMFPLNNLARYGLDGDDPFAPRMWRNNGDLSDLLSVTKSGMVMPYLPSGAFEAAATVLNKRPLIGIIGPMDSARGVQSALGLDDVETEITTKEDHFLVSLDDLIVPAGTTHIIALSEEHCDLMTGWMIDYHVATLGASPKDAARDVPDRLTREIAENSRVILMDGDTPVATTSFNAELPDIVQIGGVYTPPDQRGKGFARRAVGLHLQLARDKKARQATLFADNPSAIAAYKSVGFHEIGHWMLLIFKTPQVAP